MTRSPRLHSAIRYGKGRGDIIHILKSVFYADVRLNSLADSLAEYLKIFSLDNEYYFIKSRLDSIVAGIVDYKFTRRSNGGDLFHSAEA